MKMKLIREIFAVAFLLTRKWEVIFNRQSDELTLKQLMLLIVIKNAFSDDPTIKELSHALTTSHQNVKAIVKQLEKRDFVTLYTDDQDKRVTRIGLNKGKEDYWTKRNESDSRSLQTLFEGISVEDLEVTARTILKLNERADQQLKG